MASNPRSAVAWTPVHEDALKGLMHLGLSKQYALDLLEHVKGTQLSDIMNEALRMHSASKKPAVIQGGPRNAVPIKQPSPAAAAAPAPAPPTPVPTPSAPPPKPVAAPRPPPPPAAPMSRTPGPGEWAASQLGGQRPAARPTVSGTPLIQGQWSPTSMVPAERRPSAPIAPAAAQLQPPTPAGAPPAPPPAAPPAQKPRIRVRAAGSRIPPAPIGGQGPSTEAQTPTEAPQTPTTAAERKWIWTDAEYEKLEPGAKFIWGPNGKRYTKPEAES